MKEVNGKIEMTHRALKCGDYLFMECSAKNNSWHVPGRTTMTAREISKWARENGISDKTEVVQAKFYYAACGEDQ